MAINYIKRWLKDKPNYKVTILTAKTYPERLEVYGSLYVNKKWEDKIDFYNTTHPQNPMKVVRLIHNRQVEWGLLKRSELNAFERTGNYS